MISFNGTATFGSRNQRVAGGHDHEGEETIVIEMRGTQNESGRNERDTECKLSDAFRITK